MSQSLSIIIVEKNATLKSLTIKQFNEEDLFKKCGFKKAEDFVKQVEWKLKTNGNKYLVQVFGKTDGRANNENKYDFPPPIDTTLFFGNCAIIAKLMNEGKWEYTHLSLELWDKMYEKLFGGFEDLAATALEDENEEDELLNVPKEKKTKSGYLKDGFVVDDSSDIEEVSACDSDEDSDEKSQEEDEPLVIEDLGSELSEEAYDYDTDKEN
jgi:hypothetical protein